VARVSNPKLNQRLTLSAKGAPTIILPLARPSGCSSGLIVRLASIALRSKGALKQIALYHFYWPIVSGAPWGLNLIKVVSVDLLSSARYGSMALVNISRQSSAPGK
jgi:hypothetical protein